MHALVPGRRGIKPAFVNGPDLLELQPRIRVRREARRRKRVLRRDHIAPIDLVAAPLHSPPILARRRETRDAGRRARRKREPQRDLGPSLGVEVRILAHHAAQDADLVAEALDGLRVAAGKADAERGGVEHAEREVAEGGEALEIVHDGGEILEGAREVDGQELDEALYVERLGGGGCCCRGSRRARQGRKGVQGGDGGAERKVDAGAWRGARDRAQLAACLSLQGGDGFVALLARAGAETVELGLLA